MFDNTITLNPTTQLTGSSNANKSYDRVAHPKDGMFRVPGTALFGGETIMIKHEVRKGKTGQYQASSIRLSETRSDTVTAKTHQADAGFYVNLPIGTFTNGSQLDIDLVGRLVALVRADNTLNKLKNQET